jgi:hypothetical protein
MQISVPKVSTTLSRRRIEVDFASSWLDLQQSDFPVFSLILMGKNILFYVVILENITTTLI